MTRPSRHGRMRWLMLIWLLACFRLGTVFAQPAAGANCSGGQTYMVDFGQLDSIQAATQRVEREFDASFKCNTFSLSLLTGSQLWITVRSVNGYRLRKADSSSVAYRIYLDGGRARELHDGQEIEISSTVNFFGSEALSRRKLYIQTQAGAPDLTVGRLTDTLSITYRWSVCTLGTVFCLSRYNGSATVTVNLALGIAAACEFRTSQPRVDFGAYPLVSQIADVQTDIAFVCTNSSAYNIHISDGDNVQGAWRRMKGVSGVSSNSYIQYQLYAANSDLVINSLNRRPGRGTGRPEVLSIVGRVNKTQADVPVGSYQDRPVIIIEY